VEFANSGVYVRGDGHGRPVQQMLVGSSPRASPWTCRMRCESYVERGGLCNLHEE
jgi:hypothetical protein